LRRPLIINFKNYIEASGDKSLELARAAQEVAVRLDAEIILAPPQPSIAIISRNVTLPVICQHLDDAEVGSSTGFTIAEVAKTYGIFGSLLNHSEHRIDLKTVDNLIKRMRKINLVSFVCAQTPKEVGAIAAFRPDFIAIEPPELIGTGKAVSKENPSIITDSIKAASPSESRVICGAGITDMSDVATAIRLGAEGILVASGVVKAANWHDKIEELVIGMR